MIFFLLFWYYLLRFLDGVEKWGTSNPEGWKRQRLLSAIFLGLSFYSQTHWMIFTFLVFIFFVLILYFSERRARKILNELVRILLLGIIVGIPSIIFNFYQGMMIRETVERGLVVKVERDMWMLNNAFRLEYFPFFTCYFIFHSAQEI
jgi:4-amino-4-deoxy-L-arabinose transferase-like glycosyltransferase